MVKVITYGTFDLFHYGHLELLRRAKELGDYLIVGISTDEFNQIKGKKCVYNYLHRKAIVREITYVDKVIEECDWKQKKNDIKLYKIDMFVMGNDWEGKFDELETICKVKYLSRTKGISSSKLKIHINNN